MLLNRPPRNDPAWGYERSVPRCETCQHRRAGKPVLLRNSAPLGRVWPICQRGNFATRDNAVCNHWVGQGGTTLENAP